jgi:hypothetical protein
LLNPENIAVSDSPLSIVM